MDRLRLDITGEELKIIEHGDILMASRMDRQWWSLPERRFPDARSRDIAIETGRLVHVVVPNQYFTSPSDIRNDPYLKLLRPGANNLLFQVCKELDMAVDYSRSGFRLAVTSMYRSDELQREIINSEEWYRAAKVGSSAHGAGAAFDISIRSHYAINQSTRLLEAVNSWNESFSLK